MDRYIFFFSLVPVGLDTHASRWKPSSIANERHTAGCCSAPPPIWRPSLQEGGGAPDILLLGALSLSLTYIYYIFLSSYKEDIFHPPVEFHLPDGLQGSQSQESGRTNRQDMRNRRYLFPSSPDCLKSCIYIYIINRERRKRRGRHVFLLLTCLAYDQSRDTMMMKKDGRRHGK